MAYIVFRRAVAAAKIGRILRIGQPDRCEAENTAARNLIEGMAIGIVGLKYTRSESGELMFERNYRAVVVGDGIRRIFQDLAETRVCARRNRWAGAESRSKRSEPKRIRTAIKH